MLLFKAHGLGNDYLVLETGEPLDAALVRALCDRNTGVGGDGLLEPAARGDADYGVRIWNPDGSIAEKSGNGLRIFAWWLREQRYAPRTFRVSTGFETVRCAVTGTEVAIDMGPARFAPEEIPLRADAPWHDHALAVAGASLAVTAVGMGNPHAVVFRTEAALDDLPWRAWGAALEVHPAFPNRTNVQFARVEAPDRLSARIWERGAGATLASGSSACAVAAAAVETGRIPAGRITVEMPGGALYVTVGADRAIRLEGPVAPVGRFTLDAHWRA